MTQKELYNLYIDATELMVYDDSAEVYKFLGYLAEKYNLIFDSDKAQTALYNSTLNYFPPEE